MTPMNFLKKRDFIDNINSGLLSDQKFLWTPAAVFLYQLSSTINIDWLPFSKSFICVPFSVSLKQNVSLLAAYHTSACYRVRDRRNYTLFQRGTDAYTCRDWKLCACSLHFATRRSYPDRYWLWESWVLTFR